jgi:hypothetical protein
MTLFKGSSWVSVLKEIKLKTQPTAAASLVDNSKILQQAQHHGHLLLLQRTTI